MRTKRVMNLYVTLDLRVVFNIIIAPLAELLYSIALTLYLFVHQCLTSQKTLTKFDLLWIHLWLIS